MKKSIILSYHGTREKEKSQKIYDEVEKYFSEKFPNIKVVTAIDSDFVIKKLREEGGQKINSIDEILEELHLQGYEEIYLQPMYLLQGKILREREKRNMEYSKNFKEIKNLLPILGEMSHVKEFAEILLEKFGSESEGYLFVGHGGKDIGNCALGMIGYILSLQRDNFFVGTLEEGIKLNSLMKLLEKRAYSKIVIIPLLAQAGIHFNEDIKKISLEIEKRGIRTEIIEKTLFQYNEILEILQKRLKKEMGLI
ncbi:MAG: sirohydrochlorin cobaltochelatase [Fusobacteriaceae bacterium]